MPSRVPVAIPRLAIDDSAQKGAPREGVWSACPWFLVNMQGFHCFMIIERGPIGVDGANCVPPGVDLFLQTSTGARIEGRLRGGAPRREPDPVPLPRRLGGRLHLSPAVGSSRARGGRPSRRNTRDTIGERSHLTRDPSQ